MERSEIASGDKAFTAIIPSGITISEIKTQEEFDEIIGKYVDDPSKLTAPDSGYFEDGRVILIYEGEVDGCKAHSKFNKNLGVEDIGDRVKITVNYDQVPADEEGCSTSLRPYSIYHIKTRKELAL